MKKIYVFLVMVLCGIEICEAQIAAWDFTGVGTVSLPTYAATTFNANLVSAAGANNISRGSTAAWSTGSNSCLLYTSPSPRD